jgi:hypothetical protein
LIRLPKPALGLFVGLVVVFAGACSSSGNTFPAGPTSGAPGASSAPTTAASVAATVNPDDPSSIITQVISNGSAVTSFHIKLTLSGTIKASALSGMAGSAGGALTGDLKLDGTTIEGDVDVANEAAHLSLNVPAMQMLGNVPLTGDFIVVGNALYYKVSLLGPMYTMVDLGSLTSGLGALASSLPVAVPTAAAEATTSLADEVAQLRAAMVQAGVTTTLVGVEKIGGEDAYHISVSVPLDLINSEIAAEASSAPAMKIDSASIDVWVYTASYRIAQFELKGASSTVGNIDLTVTVSAYDQPVTISAPPASQVQATP